MSEDSVDDETIEKARGVTECHNLLVQAQRTLWFNELFKQVSYTTSLCSVYWQIVDLEGRSKM